MNICLFTKEEINSPLSLRDQRGQHLIKILHKKEGDSFSAGIIDGEAGTALITKIESREEKSPDGRKTWLDGEIHFEFTGQSDGKPLYPLVMIVGFPRPIQLKRLLRDIAGLGVCQIHLTATELGEKSYLKADLASPEECRKMLLEGTIQAAGTHVPQVFIHESLKDCLDSIKLDSAQKQEKTARFALDNVSPDMSLIKQMDLLAEKEGFNKAIAAIGSERGWSKDERELLESYGYIRTGMGIRVLRTETAATVAASLILAKMGLLG
ncbi:RsmE family RNA methyltransferase [Treponema sp.]|uniref:16S rRNA (uracil(1498)-N(3))-methyltransferase n=1 Tax=Treponema sp. TaxID=166 RepID=UPI0025DF33C8|nr:RsmE family RNA methyltransferase [Treponema sp.]MCR5218022.1 16S rRNA (uracil(1498)-N(3))-methyltransferase [Treponema sp.]